MEALQQLEASRANYKAYGETNPEGVYIQDYNPATDQMTYISVKELVDAVRLRIRQIEARNKIDTRYALADKLRVENPLIQVRVR